MALSWKDLVYKNAKGSEFVATLTLSEMPGQKDKASSNKISECLRRNLMTQEGRVYKISVFYGYDFDGEPIKPRIPVLTCAFEVHGRPVSVEYSMYSPIDGSHSDNEYGYAGANLGDLFDKIAQDVNNFYRDIDETDILDTGDSFIDSFKYSG